MLASLASAAANSTESGTSTGYVVALAGGTGVFVSGLVSFFASAYGQRREDQRARESWLREQRIEAYIALETAVLDMDSVARRGQRQAVNNRRGVTVMVRPKVDSVGPWAAFNLAKTRVMMLGPDPVREAVKTMATRVGSSWSKGALLPADISDQFGAAVEVVLGTQSKSRRWFETDDEDDVEFAQDDNGVGDTAIADGGRPTDVDFNPES